MTVSPAEIATLSDELRAFAATMDARAGTSAAGQDHVFRGMANEARNMAADLRQVGPGTQPPTAPAAVDALRNTLVTIANMTQPGLITATANSAEALATLSGHERALESAVRDVQQRLGLRPPPPG